MALCRVCGCWAGGLVRHHEGTGHVTDRSSDKVAGCPFCSPVADRVFYEGRRALGLWDAFAVSPGHALLIPRRHVATWFEATGDEKDALVEAIDIAKSAIEKRRAPDGYNIGINSGLAAGQTIFHLHVHLIPRYVGDVPDPRGGVRYVIPDRANYLGDRVADADDRHEVTTTRLLVTGGDDPLQPHVRQRLAAAQFIDVVVAFIKPSGLEELWQHLTDALDRAGQIRILTGDYLGLTEPDALVRLLDLKGRVPERVQLRVFNTAARSGGASVVPQAFHPKAYIFYDGGGHGAAFVGSSNLSKSALNSSVEWNYQVVSSRDTAGFIAIRRAFERLFIHKATVDLTPEWIEDYRLRRAINVPPQARPTEVDADDDADSPLRVPEPHSIQEEALLALAQARADGLAKGLVVLATGLGKTWLSAFDSRDFERVLFVAHREEILNQALETYRKIRPGEYLGSFHGTEKHPQAKVLFASIQTLGRQNHLDKFLPDQFDYIVVDEFHHAAAATYRRLIQYFRPKFLLGLTATPERSDGADLLDLCDGNLVFRCDLAEGIRRGLLCPFSYYGVPDEIDYANIPWRSNRFDEEALTTAAATVSRATNALEQLVKRGGRQALAFCVSQQHANFMADFLNRSGKRAVAVHAGAGSAPRAESLERLQKGELDVVCAVDMFNEGVDLPDLDTVMMLRPTESKILWLQQFGRGLRKSGADKRLKVIDYIGNHRTFLLKPRTLFDLPAGDAAIQNLLEQVQAGSAELPPGCEVTYDLQAVEILRALLRTDRSPAESLRQYVTDFINLHGVRPSALETYRDGYNPRAARQNFGSWLGLLDHMGVLEVAEVAARQTASSFLDALEATAMSKSFKMVVLLACLNQHRFPGSVSIQELCEGVRGFAEENPRVKADFGDVLESELELRRHLERNPIEAWVGGAGMGGQRYFGYQNGTFSCVLNVAAEYLIAFQELVRETAEWRLAEYMDRPAAPGEEGYVLKVSHSEGRPLIFLPDRDANPGLPEGWTPIAVNGLDYSANFVKIAINVIRKSEADDNQLPSLLRGWFGPSAGAPGTRHQVKLTTGPDGRWQLAPFGSGILAPVLWKSYSREQIPPLFGLEFHPSVWRQGFVRREKQTFLLVTLDKSTAIESQKYEDHFLSPHAFQWQSQNKTSRDDKAGVSIKDHMALGINVHLLVRPRSKLPNGKACPFTYCGQVDFVSWERDNPITVMWTLRDEVPERLREELGVPSADSGSKPG